MITPPTQASPSRHVGEAALVRLLRRYYPQGFSGLRVLDLGCGSGEYRFLFPGARYLGVDVQDEDFAEKRGDGVEFRLLDAASVNLPGPLDMVLMNHSLQYMPDDLAVLRRVAAALTPQGMVILVVPTKWTKAASWPSLLLSLVGRKAAFGLPEYLNFYGFQSIHSLCRQAGLEVIEVAQACGPAAFAAELLLTGAAVARKAFWAAGAAIAGALPGLRGEPAYRLRRWRDAAEIMPRRNAVRQTRNREELQAVWREAKKRRGTLESLAACLTALAMRLDVAYWQDDMIYLAVSARPARLREA